MQSNMDEWRARVSNVLAKAKLWWALSYVINFLIFGIALLSIIAPSRSAAFAIAVLLALALNEVALGRVDALRSDIEQAKTAADLADSFGTPYPTTIRAVMSLVPSISGETSSSYFASTQPPGAMRALENLLESTWWSQQLATTAAAILRTICASVMLVALATLLLLITSLSPSKIDSQATAQSVVAGLALLYSIGLFRIANSYASFAVASREIWLQLLTLLEADAYTEQKVRQGWQHYHLSRALAPMIPSWLWHLRRQHLSRAYQAWITGIQRNPPSR